MQTKPAPTVNPDDAVLIDAFRLWWRISRQAHQTVTNYTHSLRRISLWLSAADGRDFRTATKHDLMAYLAQRYDQVSARTGQTDYKALRAFYKWLAEDEGIGNPMLTIRGPKVNASEYEDRPGTATEDDYKALMKACRPTAGTGLQRAMATRDAAIIAVLWWLGPRPVEVVNMRIDDLDLENGEVGIRKSKTGKPRMLPIPHQDLLVALDRWRRTREALRVYDDEPALFVGLGKNGKKGRGPLTVNGLGQMFRRRRETAGVPEMDPYSFRRGRTGAYITANLSDADINRMMGWSPNSRMAAHYAREHVDRKAGERVVDLFSEGTITRLRDLD